MIRMQGNAAGLTAYVSGIEAGLRDLRPVWNDVHDVFIAFMKRVFKTEGEYTGDKWTPLNPAYAERKKREYGNKGLLQREGNLYHSFIDPDNADHVMVTGPTFAEFGSRTIYAKAHQYGRPEIKLPARPIIRDLTKAEGERIADAVLAYVLDRGRRAGRR